MSHLAHWPSLLLGKFHSGSLLVRIQLDTVRAIPPSPPNVRTSHSELEGRHLLRLSLHGLKRAWCISTTCCTLVVLPCLLDPF